MPEDQPKNGDIWNDQATKLFEAFNWETLGDSNVDLINDKGKPHGVDRLFLYTDSKKTNSNEIVLGEAKHYHTNSFKSDTLETWIKTLDNKLSNLKNSPELFNKYPILNEVPFRTGIIMVWFHNIVEYHSFRETFKNQARKIRLTRKPSLTSNRIYVFENDIILKLASLANSIGNINRGLKQNLKFHYPSIESSPVMRSEILNPNYMFSKFILAEFFDKKNVENKVVFYFGKLTLNSFYRLKYALGFYSYLDNDKPLTIYTYYRDPEFRKIKPEVLKMFDISEDRIKPMEFYSDLPSFML